VEIRGGMGEIYIYQLLKLHLYDRTSGIHSMAIHWAAAQRGGLIKKEKEKKERKFMGKLKAFPD